MNKKRVFGVVLTLVLLFLSLGWLGRLTIQKDATPRYVDFYQQPEAYDVLFFGTSHVRNGIMPLELWEDYGLTGYNFGTSGASILTSYWGMINALDYAQPKLIVLDCCRIGQETKDNPRADMHALSLHDMFDPVRFSSNKLRAIFDLCKDTEQEGNELEYLYPFSIYHSRWNPLTANDFSPQVLHTNGAVQMSSFEAPAPMEPTEDKAPLSDAFPGVPYLKKFIEHCQSQGIEVLLTYLPYPASYEDLTAANAVEDIAQAYGVHYINFYKTDVVDYDIDMADASSHLNLYGAKKVTHYLGEFIAENYDLPDRREDPAYGWMDTQLAEYRAYEDSFLRDQVYLHCYLPLLRNEARAALLYLQERSPVYNDEAMLKVIEGIPSAGEVSQLRQAAESGQPYVLYVNNASGQLIELTGRIPERLETDLGSIPLNPMSDVQCLVLDGDGTVLAERYFAHLGDGIFKAIY